MNALKGLVCAGIVGAGVFVGAPEQADAGSFSFSIGRGYGGYGFNNYGYGGRSYGYGGSYYQPRYYGGTRVWHDTSHYHYYPGTYSWHGDHGHYLPGRTIYHQDGHWDYYGHGHYGHHH